MDLSDAEVQSLQTILDTPLEKEDGIWQKFASTLQNPSEVEELAFRRGVRLLSSLVSKSTDGSLGEILKELGVVTASPKIESPPAPVKKEEKKVAPLNLPDEVIEIMKAAGIDSYVSILKGLEASPEVSAALVPLIAVMATQLKKQGDLITGAADRERTQEITEAVKAMGIMTDVAPLVTILKGLDATQRSALLEALRPGLERIKQAEELLLAERGTEARGDAGQTALVRAEGLARQKVSKGEATDFDKALEETWKENPRLYEQHRHESYLRQGGGES